MIGSPARPSDVRKACGPSDQRLILSRALPDVGRSPYSWAGLTEAHSASARRTAEPNLLTAGAL